MNNIVLIRSFTNKYRNFPQSGKLYKFMQSIFNEIENESDIHIFMHHSISHKIFDILYHIQDDDIHLAYDKCNILNFIYKVHMKPDIKNNIVSEYISSQKFILFITDFIKDKYKEVALKHTDLKLLHIIIKLFGSMLSSNYELQNIVSKDLDLLDTFKSFLYNKSVKLMSYTLECFNFINLDYLFYNEIYNGINDTSFIYAITHAYINGHVNFDLFYKIPTCMLLDLNYIKLLNKYLDSTSGSAFILTINILKYITNIHLDHNIIQIIQCNLTKNLSCLTDQSVNDFVYSLSVNSYTGAIYNSLIYYISSDVISYWLKNSSTYENVYIILKYYYRIENILNNDENMSYIMRDIQNNDFTYYIADLICVIKKDLYYKFNNDTTIEILYDAIYKTQYHIQYTYMYALHTILYNVEYDKINMSLFTNLDKLDTLADLIFEGNCLPTIQTMILFVRFLLLVNKPIKVQDKTHTYINNIIYGCMCHREDKPECLHSLTNKLYNNLII